MQNVASIFIALIVFLFPLTSHGSPFVIQLDKQIEDVSIRELQNLNNVLLKHIAWITQNSSYTYNEENLPEVVYLSQQNLNILVHGDFQVAQSEYKGSYLPDAKAGYDKERNVISLLDEYVATDPDIQYMIVHELVHFLQEVNNIDEDIIYASCPVKLEEDAYRLQRMWMIERNDENPLPNPLFVAFLTSSCETK